MKIIEILLLLLIVFSVFSQATSSTDPITFQNWLWIFRLLIRYPYQPTKIIKYIRVASNQEAHNMWLVRWLIEKRKDQEMLTNIIISKWKLIELIKSIIIINLINSIWKSITKNLNNSIITCSYWKMIITNSNIITKLINGIIRSRDKEQLRTSLIKRIME